MVYKSQKQYNALQKQAKYLHSLNKLFTVEQEKEIKTLYLSGKSSIQIAKIYKCSKPTILRTIEELPKNNFRLYKHRNCYRQFGSNNAHWKGGIKSVYDRVRNLNSYWIWHHSVLNRDNNKCTNCKCIDNLQVHHIKTLKSLILEYCKLNNKQIKELTEIDLNNSGFYNLNNGLTLCKSCHKEWHRTNGQK